MTHRSIATTAFSAAVILSSSSLAHAAGTYTNLGANLTPYSVIDGGAVVAGFNPTQCFYWTPDSGLVFVGGVGSLGSPRLDNDGTKFLASALNPATNLVEMSMYNIAGGTWTHIGSLGASSGDNASSAWGLSGDGSVAVGLGWINAGTAHAIYSIDGAPPVDMGSTVRNRSSRANNCDFDGNVIVGWQDGETGFRQGAVWIGGVQTKIFVDAAQSQAAGEAGDVDAAGTWVTGSANFGGLFRPYRWNTSTGSATGALSLGEPPAPALASWRGSATSISDDGSVIVGFFRNFPGPAAAGRGFIWTEADGMQDLTNWVTAQDVDLGGAVLALPLAVSPDGRSIVGVQSNGAGFLVTIDPVNDCPEDINGDKLINVTDLLAVIGAWGACTGCAADINSDGQVNVTDLLAVIGAWGACE